MRVTRLEVRGFGSFLHPTTVEFGPDDTLFAFTGPTGAGKTSLVDAIGFAGWGSVPRYDRRAVAPVINDRSSEARVRVDFEAGGSDYTAVRVVRRTKAGATTKEARLVRVTDGELLAADAAAVTDAMTDIVGLGFEQYVTCVSLPQGGFARFLHDTPADRQALLARLLHLDRYREMAQESGRRAVRLTASADMAQASLDGYDREVAEGNRDEVAAAAAGLRDCQERIDAALPDIQTKTDEYRTAKGEQERWERRRGLLDAVRLPDDVPLLAARASAAAAGLAAAERASAAASAEDDAAESAAAAHPSVEQVAGWRAQHAEHDTARTALAAAATARDDAERASASAQTGTVTARERFDVANAAREAALREDAAAALAEHLAVGEDCPVCHRKLDTLPTRPRPPLPPAASAAALRIAADDAARAEARASSALASAAAVEHAAEDRLSRARDALAEAPAVDALDEVSAAAESAAGRSRAARDASRASRSAEKNARTAVGAAKDAQRNAWDTFDAVRDAVVDSTTPAVDRDDLAGAWDKLAAWSGPARSAADKAARGSADTAAAAAADGSAIVEALRDTVPGRPSGTYAELRAHVAAEITSATVWLDAQHRRIAAAESAAAERDRARKEADVAKVTAAHLGSRGFERWLLEEVLARLASDASATLLQMSEGRYELTLDESRAFVVIDHAAEEGGNDGHRPARSLSGGETFQASLALALALPDVLAEWSSKRTARLGSIFLDEGFGTLDPDTLRKVTDMIRMLPSTGRVVGVVTHVAELAENLPLRFRVENSASGGSTVRRESEEVTA